MIIKGLIGVITVNGCAKAVECTFPSLFPAFLQFSPGKDYAKLTWLCHNSSFDPNIMKLILRTMPTKQTQDQERNLGMP